VTPSTLPWPSLTLAIIAGCTTISCQFSAAKAEIDGAPAPPDAPTVQDATVTFDATPLLGRCPDTSVLPTMNVVASVPDFSSAKWPLRAMVDGASTTSWYAKADVCRGAAGIFVCSNVIVEVTLRAPSTVRRIFIQGNHDEYPKFDVRTATISVDGRLSAPFVTNLSPNDPSASTGDYEWINPAPALNVTAIRYTAITAEATGPGVGEITACAE
jgi:hypothetical protein